MEPVWVPGVPGVFELGGGDPVAVAEYTLAELHIKHAQIPARRIKRIGEGPSPDINSTKQFFYTV